MTDKDYISFLEAAAHGLSNRLNEAEGLLLMAMNFMTSVEYDTTVDALQCVGIARTIKEFLSDKVESE